MAGFGEPSHVADACAYETADDAAKDYASVLAGAPRHAYFGQCTYCGHCAPCPSGIDIALVNKFYDLATMQDEVPAGVRAHYGSVSYTHLDVYKRQVEALVELAPERVEATRFLQGERQ